MPEKKAGNSPELKLKGGGKIAYLARKRPLQGASQHWYPFWRPVGIFLLVSFFFKKDYKVSQFAIFILVMIIVESTFRYFNGKSLLDYNYLIGMILGLIPVYLIDLVKQKNVA